MAINLDPCLHCGALHPEITSYVGQPLRHRIKCTECPHVIDCFSSKLDQAKGAWNRGSDANLADAQQEVARLRAALERAVSFVEHAEVSSGVCCCGDDMDRHANPMDCGHSPRDMWDYAAEGFIKETRALLDTK